MAPYLFLLPCAILILVVLIYPVFSGLVNSFYNENLIRPIAKEFVGFENYGKLLKDSMFLDALGRSVVWTIVILIFEMILGLLFAVMLNKDIYCKKLFRCLVLIPWVIPNAIAGIIWKWFLNESFGMMNYLLKQIGLINHNRLSRSHCWREFRQFLLIFTKLQRWTGRKKVSVSVSLPYRCCRTSC